MITKSNLLENLVERVDGGRVRAALFSTFTFGPGYFASGPLAAFTREGADCGVIPITVIVDSRRFRGAGRGYEVVRAPFTLWHPKVVVLMVAEPAGTGRWTVMAVGSGNLTRSGWEQNQEFFTVDSWGGWSIPKALREWVAEPWLACSAFSRWCERQGVGRKNGHRGSVLLSSVHHPLWPRLALETKDDTWTEARVLAPFSDQSADDDAEPGGSRGGFLKALVGRAAPGAKLHVYLRGLDPQRDEAVGVEVVFKDIQERLGRAGLRLHVVRPVGGRLLHAKLIAWKSRGLWSVVLGSPNATRAAMLDGPGTGNVELAWQFQRIGRTLPGGLFPKTPALSVDDVTFRAPAFDNRPLWDAVEEARYDAARDRVRVTWRAGRSVKDTELRLGGTPVQPGRIVLSGSEHRALEVLPRRTEDRAAHRASWVPIQIPAGVFDPGGGVDDDFAPEEWLQQLGDPYAVSTRDEEARADRRRTKKQGSSPRIPAASWDWSTRVRSFEGQVAALAEAIRDAETEAAIARLVRVVRGAWASHNAAAARNGSSRAWCKWVRAGIVEALLVSDGRTALHRPLCTLLASWGATVDSRLLGGRDV